MVINIISVNKYSKLHLPHYHKIPTFNVMSLSKWPSIPNKRHICHENSLLSQWEKKLMRTFYGKLHSL